MATCSNNTIPEYEYMRVHSKPYIPVMIKEVQAVGVCINDYGIMVWKLVL